MIQRALLFCLPLILLLQPDLLSQQSGRAMLLNGVVMEGGTYLPLPNAHFINSAGESGISDEKGQFALMLSTGDTIRFSMLGYSSTSYIIPDTLRAREYIAGIFLYPDTVSAGEVIINPRLGSLRSEILGYEPATQENMVNAKNNISVAVYQGLSGANELGDPLANYELVRQRQKREAYERGGIPSDRIAGFNPITFIPGLIYMMVNGIPEQYEAPKPRLTTTDLEAIKKLHNNYLETRK